MGIRDKALLLLAYDSMCRRSELVSLRVEDLEFYIFDENPFIKIRLRKSKTDQEQHGHYIFPSRETTSQIQLWINEAGLSSGFLFRGINNSGVISNALNSGQINRILKRLAKKANFSQEIVGRISGHSIRVGASQDLLKSGASLPMMMQKGRWMKSDTLMRYLEFTNPIEGLI